jgi:hypothetical protein
LRSRSLIESLAIIPAGLKTCATRNESPEIWCSAGL